MRGSNLRLIKYGPGFLSTFETNCDKDPKAIGKVEVSEHKDDNLFPSQLPENVKQFSFDTPEPGRNRYGYPICWFQTCYEWYPFLPAVIDFRYPIFRGMSRRPEIIHDTSGYRLNDQQMIMWKNVEFVMITVSNALSSGRLDPLQFKDPHYPSDYGYMRNHTQSKFAQKALTKSLNAFQRLLGYCAYAMGFMTESATLGSYGRFYSDTWVSELYKKLDFKDPDVHILAKLLLSTLWQMGKSGNHAGVVVPYERECDYRAVITMFYANVPVYVAWPGPGTNPYTQYSRHERLQDFIPKPEHFEALERSPIPEPATTLTLAASTSVVRYGIPPAFDFSRTYDHPTDYLKLRLEVIRVDFKESPNRGVMSSLLKSASKRANIGSAKLFRFESIDVIDEQTGQEKQRWVRTVLTKAEAQSWFESADDNHLWFDCGSNQWNLSEEFNVKDDMNPIDQDPPSNAIDEMDVSESHEQFCLTLEEGELMDDANESPPEEEPSVPQVANRSFDNGHFLQTLADSQFSVDLSLVDGWSNDEDFLWKRYGLRDCTGQEAHGVDQAFPKRLGLHRGPVDLSVHKLFGCLVDSSPLPAECDLSPGYGHVDGGFPDRSPNSTVNIRCVEDTYLISVNGSASPWKLLIKDPLTVIQIEREEWHLRRDGLISNLVRKGLPFEILYPSCQSGTVFYPHPGPIIHPDGRCPTPADYLAYCIDVAEFFRLYPHTYAAALCSGGILWRIAVDVLPLPDEHTILRPFHPSACNERSIDGQRYWTPKLDDEEYQQIVGMHKWADPRQSAKHDSWWPKHTTWTGSGLEFGAWAPVDESWYADRKKGLADGSKKATQSTMWKSNIKYERPLVGKFLTGARSVAKEFIRAHRL